jgi:hypothetical protein
MIPKRFLCLPPFVLASAFAPACSICFAHAFGAALQGIGAQTLERRHTVVGLSYSAFSKSNAGETPGSSEKEVHQEYLLSVLHGVSDQLMLGATVPYVDNTIHSSEGPDERASGLGDASVMAEYQLKPDTHSKFLTAFSLAVKLPTGNNNARESGGGFREQHLQTGTGSTDVTGGVSVTWEGAEHKGLWFADLQGRVNGSNSRGFHYGNAAFYGLGYSHTLDTSSALVLELNGKLVEKDRVEDGSKDPNSGGHVLFGSASYRRAIGQGFGLILSYQQPLFQRLNGTQYEHGIFSVSVSRAF